MCIEGDVQQKEEEAGWKQPVSDQTADHDVVTVSLLLMMGGQTSAP